MENQFAQANRAKKVAKYVEHFDRQMLTEGLDPFAHAAAMVGMLRDQTSDLEWRKHAVVAGQHRPSEDTKRAVIETYERRAEAYESNKVTPIRRFGGTH